jgi:hypothetical protein
MQFRLTIDLPGKRDDFQTVRDGLKSALINVGAKSYCAKPTPTVGDAGPVLDDERQNQIGQWTVIPTPEAFNGSKILRDAMRKSDFLTAYVEALFFTEVTPDSDESMQDKDVDDVSFALARQLIHDCAVFEAAHDREIDSDYKSAGHDFWLTRNGHGAGFWDGDWPEEEGERMTATSKAFGECEIYAGDDGLLYSM